MTGINGQFQPYRTRGGGSSVHYGRAALNTRYHNRAYGKALDYANNARQCSCDSFANCNNFNISYETSNSFNFGKLFGFLGNFLLSLLGSKNNNNYANYNNYTNNNNNNYSNNNDKQGAVSTPVSNNPTVVKPQGEVTYEVTYNENAQSKQVKLSEMGVTENEQEEFLSTGTDLSDYNLTVIAKKPDNPQLKSALEKEFGKDFIMPAGYKAELLSNGTLRITGPDGHILTSTEMNDLKGLSNEADEIIKQGNVDGDDKFTQKEAAKFIKGLAAAEGITISDEDAANYAYKLDTFDDGNITKDDLQRELPKVMQDLKGNINPEEIDEEFNSSDMMETSDLDGDGKISKEEFGEFKTSVKDLGYDTKFNDKNFEDLDKNNDGSISKEELG